MPDPHMPDLIVDDLRRENARLRHENHDLTVRVAECLEHSAQYVKALARAADDNRELARKLSQV